MKYIDFIHKDVNKGLLVFLLALIFFMAGLEVFYALNFKAINNEYNDKITQLNDTYNKLVRFQGELNATQSELQLTSAREEGLTAQYTGVKTERDSLFTERNQLKADNDAMKATLVQKDALIDSMTVQYQALNRSYYNQIAQIETLNSQVASLQSQVAACTA